MRVVISAGGTGGHINPALAIGKYISEQSGDNSVLFIGANGKMDKKLYGGCSLPYRLFDSKGLDRKKFFNNFNVLKTDFKAYRSILKEIDEFKPDVGVSCGGYISAMTMLGLKKKKIPFIVHEQNAIPGLTTKLLSRYAVKYAYAFENANKMLKFPERGVFTGNPVRGEFNESSKKEARYKLGFSDSDKIILCFGGSLGAKKLNEVFRGMLPMAKNENFKLVVGTGSAYYADYAEFSDKYDNIIIKEYINDMPLWMNACDMAVTRAGAMTVSELCAIKKPSVLIPSPNVTADHQTKNALQLVNAGGAIMLKEASLTSDTLFDTLKRAVNDKKGLEKMEKSLEPLSVTDGAKRVYDILARL